MVISHQKRKQISKREKSFPNVQICKNKKLEISFDGKIDSIMRINTLAGSTGMYCKWQCCSILPVCDVVHFFITPQWSASRSVITTQFYHYTTMGGMWPKYTSLHCIFHWDIWHTRHHQDQTPPPPSYNMPGREKQSHLQISRPQSICLVACVVVGQPWWKCWVITNH